MIGLVCTVVMEVSGVSAPRTCARAHTHTHDVVCTMYNVHTYTFILIWALLALPRIPPCPLKAVNQDTKHIKRDNAFGAAKEGHLCSCCDGGKGNW
jgi:hypothetical protein